MRFIEDRITALDSIGLGSGALEYRFLGVAGFGLFILHSTWVKFIEAKSRDLVDCIARRKVSLIDLANMGITFNRRG